MALGAALRHDDPSERPIGLDFADDAVRRGELVVLPTDTVYGLGTDAFNADAVAGLLGGQGPRPGHARARARRLAAHPRRHRDRPQPTTPATSSRGSGRAGSPLVAWVAALAAVGPRRHRRAPSRSGCRCTRWPSSCWPRTGPMAVSSANRSGQAAGHDRRRGDRAARRVGVGLPRRRPVRRGRAVHDRRRHRVGGPGAAGGGCERRGAAEVVGDLEVP